MRVAHAVHLRSLQFEFRDAMMFAQLPTVSAEQLGWWLISAAAVLAIWNQGAKALRPLKSVPPTGEVAGTVASLSDRLCEHVADCKSAHETLQGQINEAEERRKYIHERIEEKSVEHTDAINGLRLEVKRDIENLRKENKDDAGGLHKRIDDVLRAVSELRGEMKGKR